MIYILKYEYHCYDDAQFKVIKASYNRERLEIIKEEYVALAAIAAQKRKEHDILLHEYYEQCQKAVIDFFEKHRDALRERSSIFSNPRILGEAFWGQSQLEWHRTTGPLSDIDVPMSTEEVNRKKDEIVKFASTYWSNFCNNYSKLEDWFHIDRLQGDKIKQPPCPHDDFEYQICYDPGYLEIVEVEII